MSDLVPKNRPGVVRLAELSPEQQAAYAQRDATSALLKLKRMTERIDVLEQNFQALANFVRELAERVSRIT